MTPKREDIHSLSLAISIQGNSLDRTSCFSIGNWGASGNTGWSPLWMCAIDMSTEPLRPQTLGNGKAFPFSITNFGSVNRDYQAQLSPHKWLQPQTASLQRPPSYPTQISQPPPSCPHPEFPGYCCVSIKVLSLHPILAFPHMCCHFFILVVLVRAIPRPCSLQQSASQGSQNWLKKIPHKFVDPWLPKHILMM